MVSTPHLGLETGMARGTRGMHQLRGPLDPAVASAQRRALWVGRLSKAAIVGAVATVAVTAWIYREPMTAWLETKIATATGATVQRIVIEGAGYTDRAALQQALELKRGESLVGYNTGAARVRLEELPWVQLATVERQLPDTLKVSLYEFTPLARVDHEGETWVVNKDGERIAADIEGRFGQLPLVQGEGGPQQAARLFALLAEWPNMVSQLSEATWVGQRRWDLQFVSGLTVRLPENGAEVALQRLAQLEEARHVLTLNAGEVDLRLADRIVLKLPAEVKATPVTDKRGFERAPTLNEKGQG